MTDESQRDAALDAVNLLVGLGEVRNRRETVDISCRYQCHSGETFTGKWRGVRLADLLDDAAPETTHRCAVSAPVSVPLRSEIAVCH